MCRLSNDLPLGRVVPVEGLAEQRPNEDSCTRERRCRGVRFGERMWHAASRPCLELRATRILLNGLISCASAPLQGAIASPTPFSTAALLHRRYLPPVLLVQPEGFGALAPVARCLGYMRARQATMADAGQLYPERKKTCDKRRSTPKNSGGHPSRQVL